jgi:hypothetical protein
MKSAIFLFCIVICISNTYLYKLTRQFYQIIIKPFLHVRYQCKNLRLPLSVFVYIVKIIKNAKKIYGAALRPNKLIKKKEWPLPTVLMSVFCVYFSNIPQYQNLQQLELPDARS